MKLLMATTALFLVTSVASADNCEQSHDNPPWCDLTGAQGPQGEKGDTGDVGAKGDTGATGAQGPKGDTGTQGARGNPGSSGSQGPQGKAGKSGRDGATPLGALSFTAAAFSIPDRKSGIGFGLSQGYNDDTIEGSIVLKKGWKDRRAGFVIGYTANDDGQDSFSAGIGWSF